MRQFALSHKDLSTKLLELENKYDQQFKDVYDAINFLLQQENQSTIFLGKALSPLLLACIAKNRIVSF